MEYQNVKIPKWAYDNGKRLQAEVLRKGIDSIPAEIRRPLVCPYCESELNYVELRYRYCECPRCGYRQQAISVESNIGEIIAGVGLGLLIGWGMGQLIRVISGEKRKELQG